MTISSHEASSSHTGHSIPDDMPQLMGMPGVPAIDLHCHLRVAPEHPSTCLGADDVQKELERFNIQFSAVSATEAYLDDMNVGNREMLESVETHDRLLGSVVVNLNHLDDSIKWLDIAAAHPRVVHVTVCPMNVYERFSSSRWIRLFAEIAARNLPVFYNSPAHDLYRRSPVDTLHGHLYCIRAASPGEVEMFRRVDQLFPEMPVVLGHGLGLEGLDLARSCRNFYLDLCSSHPEQNVYRRAIDAVGADRIVLGTDLEMFSPAFVLGSVWEAQMNNDEQRKVMRENAYRILKLPG